MVDFQLEKAGKEFVIYLILKKGTRMSLYLPRCPKCKKPALFQMPKSNRVFCYNCGALFEPQYKEV